MSFNSYKLFSYFLIISIYCTSLSGQNEEFIIDNIQKGLECLKVEGNNCNNFFDKSLSYSYNTKDDSITAATYLSIIKSYERIGVQPQTLIDYASEGLKFSKDKKLKSFQWKMYASFQNVYSSLGDFNTMMLYSDSSIILARSLANKEFIVKSIIQASWGMQNQGKGREALNIISEAKSLAEELNDTDLINHVYGDLTSLYGLNGDFELCRKYAELTREVQLERGDSLLAMYSLTNWCNATIELGKPEEVLDKLPVAIDYFERHERKNTAIYPMAQLGKAYNVLGRFSEAIPILTEASLESKRLEVYGQEALCNALLSESYFMLGNNEGALKYSTKAYNYQKDKGISVEYSSVMLKHSQALKANGQFKNALAAHEMYELAKDSLFQKDKIKEIATIQEEFESQLRDNKIAMQEGQIQLLKEEKNAISNRNIGLIIGLILAGIIAWLLVKRKSALIKLRESENKNLTIDLESKKRELTTQALHLAQKNELLGSLKKDLKVVQQKGSHEGIINLSNKIRIDEQIDNNWEQFTKAFNETKTGFIKTLRSRHDDLGKSDMRLAALLSMNLSSKEIASILNISDEGVKKARYRLRKKLSLNPEDNLIQYLAAV